MFVTRKYIFSRMSFYVSHNQTAEHSIKDLHLFFICITIQKIRDAKGYCFHLPVNRSHLPVNYRLTDKQHKLFTDEC